MQLFVQAVRSGSLSAAGRAIGYSPAVASKRLSRMEEALKVRLLHRTSRRLTLTEEGEIYYERCAQILADVAEAGAEITAGSLQARGHLKVTATVALGRRKIGPVVAQFAIDHPGVSVHLSLTDAVVDLVAGGFDVAVRIGELQDSRLISRKLADDRRVICGAPAYFARHGRPQVPADLLQHRCLILSRSGQAAADWAFVDQAQPFSLRVNGALAADTGDQIHDWALAGLGLQRRTYWDVADDLASGRLEEVLAPYSPADVGIHLVYASRRHLPAKTRLLMDALTRAFATQP
ncbi:MAG: LysR family transcriptional regulator [Sphingomonadaceae bacterium]